MCRGPSKVFAIDVLECPRCAGRLQLVAFVADGGVAKRILNHLGMWSQAPPLARAVAGGAPDDGPGPRLRHRRPDLGRHEARLGGPIRQLRSITEPERRRGRRGSPAVAPPKGLLLSSLSRRGIVIGASFRDFNLRTKGGPPVNCIKWTALWMIGAAPALATALSVDGVYVYEESGCRGEMRVSENKEIGLPGQGGGPYIEAEIVTACGEMPFTCNLKVRGTRIISSDAAVEASFESEDEEAFRAKFMIKFAKSGAVVDVQSRGGSCGMNGGYGGKWALKGAKPESRAAAGSRSKAATAHCSEWLATKKACFKKAAKGIMPDQALAKIKGKLLNDETRETACHAGYSAYGRAGAVPDDVLNQAIQSEFAKCFDQMMLEE